MLSVGPVTGNRLTKEDADGVVAADGLFAVGGSGAGIGGLAMGKSLRERLQQPNGDADVTPPVEDLTGRRFVDLADGEPRIFPPPTRTSLGRGTSS